MDETVRLLFVGDISLGGQYSSRYGMGNGDWTAPFIDIEPIFRDVDIRIGNLESPLFYSISPRKKKNLMAAPPDSVQALSYLDFTAMNLANNHITDQGGEGIIKTRDILNNDNIFCFGAGENLDSARRPVIINASGVSFACLGYALDRGDVGARMATESSEGCSPLFLDHIEKDFAAVRDKASHVIVSLHWGYQFDLYPEPRQMEVGRRLIDLGALIVYGHHPHVVQGLERYKHGLIMYSLGNFYFPDFKRTDGCWFHFPGESRRSVIVQCEVGKNGVQSVSLLPIFTDSNFRIERLRDRKADRAIRKLNRSSAILNTTNYDEYWFRHHKKTVARRVWMERRLWICDGIVLLWRQIRTRGLIASIKRFRIRHVVEVLRKIRQLWHRNHS